MSVLKTRVHFHDLLNVLSVKQNGNKHNIVKWEGRPKDHNSNPYKSIFITITLSSQETLQTLR